MNDTSGPNANAPGQPPAGEYTTPTNGPRTSQGDAAFPQAELRGGAIANYLGIVGFLGPLIYRATAGNKSTFARSNAISALNFQLSLLVYFAVLSVAMLLLGMGIGADADASSSPGAGIAAFFIQLLWFALSLVLFAWNVIASCIGASQARRGVVARYLASVPFFKKRLNQQIPDGDIR
ncbi:MAG TPA: DUF4870 domain-containing protein [Candidatus Stackebrandtia faecavium]|nr:DUF4870 domain-containing protein [Candidatus Stackebrandtia faecavium]